MEGALGCGACAVSFPIRAGIPRFADLAQVEKTSKPRPRTSVGSGSTSRRKIRVTPNSFLVGSRRSRRSFSGTRWCSRVVAARDVTRSSRRVGVRRMLWGSISVWQLRLRLPRLVRCRMCTSFRRTFIDLPLARKFDYAFSVGVLHHLPDPRGGFLSLASKVKPGGHLSGGFMALRTMNGSCVM